MSKTPDNVTIPEIAEESALSLFSGDARIENMLKAVEEEVSSLVLDPSNKKDYAHYGSIGRRISSFKVALDKKGKEIVDPLKAQCKEVDAMRKKIKDRMDALRDQFLLPRSQYDDEIKAHEKAVADALELFRYGHTKVGEFKAPTIEEWDALLEKVETFSMDEGFFADKLTEAKELQATAIDMIKLKRDQFIEDEKVKEAGRKALQEQQDKEAAERHKQREEAKAKADAEAAKTPAQKPAAPLSKREVETTTHRQIVSAITELGLDISKDQSVGILTAIYQGRIKGLAIQY